MLSSPDRALASAGRGLGIGARTAIAVALLFVEKTFLNLFVDFEGAQQAQGLGAVVRVTQHWGFRFLVSFAIVAAVFGYLRRGTQLQQVDAEVRAEAPLRPRWLLAHLVLIALLMPLSASLYRGAVPLPFAVVVALWLLLAICASAALFAALAPGAIWWKAVRALGNVWWYAAIAAAGAAAAMGWSQSLWTGMTRVTFEAVYRLLGWLVPNLRVDPANMIIDTGRFGVMIAPICSGLEGMGLMLAFCTALLLLFRREYVFPRALLLLPAGLLLSFALNIARIAALVLIGNAGYEAVALYGFHSQAGWISFNAAAVGIALVSLRSPWLNRAAAVHREAIAGENPTAVYLLPYVALLLAGLVSGAASGGFEGLYWLRLLAVGAAFCYSWPRLRNVDWRFSWRGGAAGLAVFVLWIATARMALPPHGMPAGLAALPSVARAGWIIGHVVVSVAAIPVAEELAFRGYLLRRIRATDFESVAPGQAGAMGLMVSAILFGLCQGAFWLPGTISGLALGLLYMRTGRLGEAIAAHVTVNALIALAVLAGSQWQLW